MKLLTAYHQLRPVSKIIKLLISYQLLSSDCVVTKLLILYHLIYARPVVLEFKIIQKEVHLESDLKEICVLKHICEYLKYVVRVDV